MIEEHSWLGNLKRVRATRGVSQSLLAEAAGLDRRTIQRYEAFEMRASLDAASRVAWCLSVRPEDLMGEPPRPAFRGSAVDGGETKVFEREVLRRLGSMEACLERVESAVSVTGRRRGFFGRLFGDGLPPEPETGGTPAGHRREREGR